MQEDRTNQKTENKGMKNKVIGIHFIYFLVVSVIMGCTPMKRTASTEIKTKADYSEITNELRTQRTQLDKVTETMSKTKEQIAEWLNENVNYEEQKYDSLGRLISTIKQTTSRNGGTTTVKQGDIYVYEGVTVQQVDSIVSEQMKRLRSELMAKNMEKKESKGILSGGIAFIKYTLILLAFIFVSYKIWVSYGKPNLWRKFVNWVKHFLERK